jgi:hypothetical protein
MLALFGAGLHPNADALIAVRVAAGVSFEDARAGVRLGRRFAQYDNTVPLTAALKAAYTTFEQRHDRWPSVQERRRIKEATATALLTAGNPNAEPSIEQVRTYLADELGKARQPVAGFDLVFSPVKSVSLLWALGGHEIRTIVEEVHEAAWRRAVAYGEQVAAFTRIGAGGIAQVPTHGFVATAFVHRDSRAGDPDLHPRRYRQPGARSGRDLAHPGQQTAARGRGQHERAVQLRRRAGLGRAARGPIRRSK